MKVRIVSNADNIHARRIESAVSLINGCQHFYHLELTKDAAFARNNTLVSAETLSSEIESKWPNEFTILITEDGFDDNWFSHEYRTSAVITTADWEGIYAPPSLRAFVMYQLAQALIHFSADMSEEMFLRIVHEPPTGCIYDMAVHKSDIKLGMVAGTVCPKCVTQLRALGTDQSAITAVIRILSLVRAEALGQPITFDPQEVFIVMRFSRNDENDNAWKYGIKKAIEQCGLKAVRADERVESGQILEKLDRYIRRSRMVIAKIDENNLNVYYELGLAMGLDKDVLLVTESDLVLNLPSDLRNWECLTYEKGNYEQLAQNVEKFLRENYKL